MNHLQMFVEADIAVRNVLDIFCIALSFGNLTNHVNF